MTGTSAHLFSRGSGHVGYASSDLCLKIQIGYLYDGHGPIKVRRPKMNDFVEWF